MIATDGESSDGNVADALRPLTNVRPICPMVLAFCTAAVTCIVVEAGTQLCCPTLTLFSMLCLFPAIYYASCVVLCGTGSVGCYRNLTLFR
jgi:hypothetical protein